MITPVDQEHESDRKLNTTSGLQSLTAITVDRHILIKWPSEWQVLLSPLHTSSCEP